MTTGINNRKEAVKEILLNRDHEGLKRWTADVRNPLRVLISFLYNPDKLICYRATEAIGIVAGEIADDSMKLLRKTLRHFFWTMNDESGNFCRYSPESIGEILYNVPLLIEEYGHMLPPFLVEEPFEAGTRIAMMRVAQKAPDCFDMTAAGNLIESLDDSDPAIRGTSILALAKIGSDLDEARTRIAKLTNDDSSFELYDFETGNLEKVTVGQVANRFGESS